MKRCLLIVTLLLIAAPAAWASEVTAQTLSLTTDKNIPVMFAVLTMNPDMSQGQWLLVTLTAGVGGSLLSIGSAAVVSQMGQARGTCTFFQPPEVDSGYRARLCSEYPGTHVVERESFYLWSHGHHSFDNGVSMSIAD